MQGLAVLRTGAFLGCLPFFVACSGGGSGSTQPSLPNVQSPQQSVVRAASQQPGARLASGRLKPAGCTPFPYKAPDLPAPCTVYVGGFISPTNGESPAQQIASTAQFEQQIGRKLALNLDYYQWTDAFPGIIDQDDAQHGRIPFISWHCGDTDANVINGNDDSLIAKRAAQLAAFGKPVFLRYKWEMNLLYNKKCQDPANDWQTPGHYNPTLYIEAWNHIRSVFAANGAYNVVWVWNPSSSGLDPTQYYPGSNGVDWISFDRYDTSADADFVTTMSEQLIGHNKPVWTYPTMQKIDPTKPVIIGETGIQQTGQPAYIGEFDAGLQEDFPNIQAIVYWDSTGQRGHYQLLQYGIQAFQQFAAGPYEQGGMP